MAAGVESPSHPWCRVLADYLPHSESQRPRVPIPGVTRDSRLYPGCPGCHKTVALLVPARPAPTPATHCGQGWACRPGRRQLGCSPPRGGMQGREPRHLRLLSVSPGAGRDQDAQEVRRKQTQGTHCSAASSLHLSEPRWP